MGLVLHGNAKEGRWQDLFVEKTVELLNDPDLLKKKQEWIREVSMRRFSIEKILSQWDAQIFNRG